MEFYERRYRWADELCNVGRSKSRSSRMDGGQKSKSREEAAEEMRRVVEACKLMTVETPIDATIEALEIMLTICSEAEKELVEGLKAGTSNGPSQNFSCSVGTQEIKVKWYSQRNDGESDSSSCECALHREQEALHK
ncbi:hypothetical protein R1sor_008501 [Riccia sorocarpa]|uniref:Uncharacterized protein n=1 Tax=Riccia sorocarpa TaxID=122646 RepID=A0ABD3HXN2_9MARC